MKFHWNNQSGATLLETALLLSLGVVVMLASMGFVGRSVEQTFSIAGSGMTPVDESVIGGGT